VDKKLTPAEITIVASGLVVFVFSFFPYFGKSPFSVNGWDSFPLFTYGALVGILLAAVVLATKLGGMQLPSNIAGFTWPQIHLVLALFAFLTTFGVYIAGNDAKIGLLLGMLGSIGLVVGAVLLRQEAGSSSV
jgi:hypothetical protein